MTPPQKTEPSPTLLEDLEAAANVLRLQQAPLRELDSTLGKRLRSAAARLREEMERADPLHLAVLTRINGGPQDVKP